MPSRSSSTLVLLSLAVVAVAHGADGGALEAGWTEEGLAKRYTKADATPADLERVGGETISTGTCKLE